MLRLLWLCVIVLLFIQAFGEDQLLNKHRRHRHKSRFRSLRNSRDDNPLTNDGYDDEREILLSRDKDIVIALKATAKKVKVKVTKGVGQTSFKMKDVVALSTVEVQCLNKPDASDPVVDGPVISWTSADKVSTLDTSKLTCLDIIIQITSTADFPVDGVSYKFFDQADAEYNIHVLGFDAARVTVYFGTNVVPTERYLLDDWEAIWTDIGAPANKDSPAPIVSVHPKNVDGKIPDATIKNADLDQMTKVEIKIPNNEEIMKTTKLFMYVESSYSNTQEFIEAWVKVKNADPERVEWIESFEQWKDDDQVYSGGKFTFYLTAGMFRGQNNKWLTGVGNMELFVNQVQISDIRFLVSPWLAGNHKMKIDKLFMFQSDPLNVDKSKTYGQVKTFITAETGSAANYIGVDKRFTWTQDVFESGYVQGGKTGPTTLAWGSSRFSPRGSQSERVALTPALASTSQFDGVDSPGRNIDPESGGNLEATPPYGKWPLGRIYLGVLNPRTAQIEKMITDSGVLLTDIAHQVVEMKTAFSISDLETVQFFKKQSIQTPIELYSLWLSVGHVDEMISFVPTNDGFRIMLAWPDDFFTMVDGYPSADDGVAVKIKWDEARTLGTWKASPEYDELKKYNKQITAFQKYNMQQIKTAFGIADDDDDLFVKVPLPYVWEDVENTAGSLFPDVVNCIVGDGKILVPNAGFRASDENAANGGKLDVINKVMFDKFAGLGVEIHQTDDFWAFKNMGDVHCLTNTIRKPAGLKNWWEKKPDT